MPVARYGPAGPYYAIAALGILLALVAVAFLMKKTKDPLDRLSFHDDRLKDDRVRLRAKGGAGGNLHGVAPLVEPSTTEELSATRRDLSAAGYKRPSAVPLYYLARAGLGLGFLLVGAVVFVLLPGSPQMAPAVALAGALGLAGYFAPLYWVRWQIKSRRLKIQNSFADAMDMMLVCIEGGHSLDQAVARVALEMRATGSPLAEELQTVRHELHAGLHPALVLRDFADRCTVDDISGLVPELFQPSASGTSISRGLRALASEMRDRRLMRAEEKAHVLPMKLTLGTMMFTVPPLILILAGPPLMQIVKSLTQFGTGP